jgi:hypothetical protein
MGGLFGKKPKAPKIPDYVPLVKNQAAEQQQFLQKQTEANRPDQMTAFGSLKWSQDPATGRWTQTEALSAPQQAALDSAQGLQTSMFDRLKGQAAWDGGPAMPTYDELSGEKHGQRLAESLMARVRPQQAAQQSQMQTKLRLQGLQPGTAAYDRAYQNMLTSHGDVGAQAELQGMLAGAQESRDIYNTQLGGQRQGYEQSMQNYMLPWQQAQAAQGLVGGVKTPGFQGFNTAGEAQAADVTGATQQGFAQKAQLYNQQMQSRDAKMNSMASLGGAAIKASDIALKQDIEQIADEAAYNTMLSLIPISWKWKDTKLPDAGISAQQVFDLVPELVSKSADGFLQVNYTGLFGILLGAFRHMAKQEREHGVL